MQANHHTDGRFVAFRQVPPQVGKRFSRKDRKSTRLNSSHLGISYAVFCLKKKNDRRCFHPYASAASRRSSRTSCGDSTNREARRAPPRATGRAHSRSARTQSQEAHFVRGS